MASALIPHRKKGTAKEVDIKLRHFNCWSSLIGGNYGLETSDLLDPSNDIINPGPTLPFKIYKHKMLVRPSDGEVFFLGGKTCLVDCADLLKVHHELMFSYNFASDNWSFYANATLGRFVPGIMMTDDETKIVMAGGKHIDGTCPSYCEQYTVEIYDFASDSWTFGASMPLTSLSFHGFVKVDNSLMAFTDQTNTVYQYDPETNTWTLLEDIVSDAILPDAIALFIGESYNAHCS